MSLIRVCESNDFIVDYDVERGMYRVSYFEDNHFKDECWFDAYKDKECFIYCKDCKHHRERNEYERNYLAEDVLICTSPDATDDCWNPVWPEHFCSYGDK